uniref:Uncharacterized protein n=1 Tax=Anguilla anguilla TaxID=7936 RepID=A0A0E9P6G9_ANGAN
MRNIDSFKYLYSETYSHTCYILFDALLLLWLFLWSKKYSQ